MLTMGINYEICCLRAQKRGREAALASRPLNLSGCPVAAGQNRAVNCTP